MKEAHIVDSAHYSQKNKKKGTYLVQYHQDLVELQGHGRRRGGRVAAEVSHPFSTARAKEADAEILSQKRAGSYIYFKAEVKMFLQNLQLQDMVFFVPSGIWKLDSSFDT